MIGQGLRVIRLALAIKGCAAQCVGLCIPRDRRVEPLCHVDEHAGHIVVLDEEESGRALVKMALGVLHLDRGVETA